jgi:glycosyltransferase involved in cell wall biosynthesis
MNNNKILILRPRSRDGGLANYINSIESYFSSSVSFFFRGKENWPESKGIIRESIRFVGDYCKYCNILKKNDFGLVHINLHFCLASLFRDSLFLIIAKLLNKRIIIFFHGWNENQRKIVEKYFLILFKNIFFYSDAIIVLSSIEKKIISQWGYKKPIYLETMVADNRLIKNISKDFIREKIKRMEFYTLLFLSRIEIAKGVYNAIDAYRLLRKNKKNIRLIIAGKGSELKNVKNYVKQNKIPDVEIVGFVQGENKRNIFSQSSIYVFPTYGEGMPNSVLEAFSFGLPVVTRSVGGLIDIFRDGKNGYFIESKNPKEIAKCIDKLISNKKLMETISLNNYSYAQSKFLASVAVKRLEEIYFKILKVNNT